LPQGDSKLLEFGDTTKLQEYDDGGYRWLQEQGLDCPCLIENVGYDNLFLVEVVQISRKKTKGLNTPLIKETSVAKISKKGRKSFLERFMVLYYSTFEEGHEDRRSEIHEKSYNFATGEDEYLVAYPFVPTRVEDCLPLDNSVLCSVDQFMPAPVNLEEGTLLGRLDGRIQSIDAQELRQILNGDDDTYLKLTDKELEHVFKDIRAVILSNLTALRKTISLRTRRVDLVGVESSVEAPFFRAKPSERPKSPRPGTFFFNKGNGKFEGFNGNDWVTLGAE
jgi:hypothetical protein